MRRDHLICASCSGRVVEGRCPVCREARAQLFNGPSPIVYLVLAALALLAVVWGVAYSMA